MQSAFIKGNTITQLIAIEQADSLINQTHKNEVVKIKIEIDTNPPSEASYEQLYRLSPQPYASFLYDKPSLFAEKLHASLCQNWKASVKGRNFYDYLWYLRQRIPVNLIHLESRMRQSGHWKALQRLTQQDLLNLLDKRFAKVDFHQAKQDVIPFIRNPAVLDLWSKEFFTAATHDALDIQ